MCQPSPSDRSNPDGPVSASCAERGGRSGCRRLPQSVLLSSCRKTNSARANRACTAAACCFSLDRARESAVTADQESLADRPSKEHTNSNSKRRRRTPAHALPQLTKRTQNNGRPPRLPHLPQAAARASVRQQGLRQGALPLLPRDVRARRGPALRPRRLRGLLLKGWSTVVQSCEEAVGAPSDHAPWDERCSCCCA